MAALFHNQRTDHLSRSLPTIRLPPGDIQVMDEAGEAEDLRPKTVPSLPG